MNGNRGAILLDGGVGRELKRRGVEVPPTIWTAKALLSAPDAVRDVHAAFIESGADVITANNYAVVPKLLATEGLDDRLAGNQQPRSGEDPLLDRLLGEDIGGVHAQVAHGGDAGSEADQHVAGRLVSADLGAVVHRLAG